MRSDRAASAVVANAHSAATPMATTGRRLMTYPQSHPHRPRQDRTGDAPAAPMPSSDHDTPRSRPHGLLYRLSAYSFAAPAGSFARQANRSLGACVDERCGEILTEFCQLLQIILR